MKIRFYFDPICPWCWVTSRWLMDVKSDRSIEVEWMPFSLAIKNNENLESDDDHVFTHKLLRIGAQLKEQHPEMIEEFYTTTGKLIHVDGQRDPQSIAQQTLKSLSLDSDLISALDNEEYDSKITDSMQTALDVVGDDVGTPIILFESDDEWNGYFGPVISALPNHEDGLKLWDGLSEMASNKLFYELKRTRTEGANTASTKVQFDK